MSRKKIFDKTTLKTPWFELVERMTPYSPHPHYIVNAPDYVTILAITKKKKVLLVKQYRAAVNTFTLELPAGTLEKNEKPMLAIQRELLEETGYKAEKIHFLGALKPDTGRLGNQMWAYFTDCAEKYAEPCADDEGVVLVEKPLKEFLSDVKLCKFDHALHLAVILLAILKGHLKI